MAKLMKKNGNIPMYRNILEHKAIKDCAIKEKKAKNRSFSLALQVGLEPTTP